MFKPCAHFERITDISGDYLKSKNIKAIIVDVDNTLIDLDRNQLPNIIEWATEIKKQNIKICVASNSIKKGKVEKIANLLDVPYVYASIKPLKRGLKKAIKILNVDSEDVAEIGDQLFTDVIGANRMKMFSILTNPISPEKFFIAKIKRKIEKIVLNKVEQKNWNELFHK